MLTVYPEYYSQFRCLADMCRHTCCAGWEIDIDADTRAKYRGISGALGRRLADAIDDASEPSRFRLTDDERCPFLNAENLCDLILAGGEDMLCQICRDHPRFRSFWPGRTEIGVGLCCEAAAALILAQTAPVQLLSVGEEGPENPDAAALLSLREQLFAVAQDRSLPLDQRMDILLNRCGAVLPERSMAEWAEFYLGLERMDPAWTDVMTDLKAHGDLVDIISFRTYMADRVTEYEQLLVYFLYRHFAKAYDDGDITSKAAFAVLSVRLLFTLGALHYEAHGSFLPAEQAEYARLYSAEIEYSEDNMDALFDELFCDDGEA